MSLIELRQDHPHACGEKHVQQKKLKCTEGPSPRVWGKVSLNDVNNIENRTIPTRVGKSRSGYALIQA